MFTAYDTFAWLSQRDPGYSLGMQSSAKSGPGKSKKMLKLTKIHLSLFSSVLGAVGSLWKALLCLLLQLCSHAMIPVPCRSSRSD